MTHRYGRDWAPPVGRPVEEIDEAEARRRYETGEEQVSVSRVGAVGAVPDHTVVAAPAGTDLRVERYDAAGSVVDLEHWKPVPGREGLFLSNLSRYVYREGTTGPQSMRDAVAIKAWTFWPDGRGRCRETVKGLPAPRISQYKDLDVSDFWRDRPAFDDLEAFAELPPPGGRETLRIQP